jgi:hypothetical protein
MAPELAASPAKVTFKPGNYAFRYVRKQILTFRNDIWRANIVYGVYDVGRMAIAAMRHQPIPPMNGDDRPTVAVLPGTIPSGSQ